MVWTHAYCTPCQSIPRSQDSTGMNTCMVHPPLVRVSQDPGQYWCEHMHTAPPCQSIPRSRDTLITYMSCKGCLVLRCLQLGSSFLICKKCAWLSPSEALDCLLFNGTMSNWSRMLLICCFSQFWGHLDFLASFKKGPSIAWYNFDPGCKCFITGRTCCVNNYPLQCGHKAEAKIVPFWLLHLIVLYTGTCRLSWNVMGENRGKWPAVTGSRTRPGHLWLEPPVLCHWATTAGQPPTLTILYIHAQ